MNRLAQWGVLVSVVLSSSNAFAQSGRVQSFMPDNDLWMEDSLSAQANVSEATFKAIVAAGREIYEPIARQNNERLQINERWNDSTVNANCGRSFGTVTVNMFGGLARRPEVTPEGFALVLCHELGHAYGGEPFIQPQNRMAAEGQADFYGTGVCAQTLLKKIANTVEPGSEPPYAVQKCGENVAPDSDSYSLCVRRFAGAQSLGNLLATLMHENPPNFETPDPTVVTRTELSYPATVQCRVDTMHNAILNMARPKCWFKN